MEPSQWVEFTKRILKSELVKRGISHEELAYRLCEMGIPETKASINSKLSRGTFSATFLLQALNSIRCFNIEVMPLGQISIAAEPQSDYGISKKQNL